MTETDILRYALNQFAGISDEDFQLSENFWKTKSYKKGEYFNHHRNVCKCLGFIINGGFRSSFINEKTGEEKNIFFYSKHGFVVTFKSFINQVPCEYHTRAMVDSQIVCINIEELLHLYKISHKWEAFGRLLAQEAFNIAMSRTESFLFKSPEERYIDMVTHYPDILEMAPLYHVSSYLGIQGPSLSRIRKRILTGAKSNSGN